MLQKCSFAFFFVVSILSAETFAERFSTFNITPKDIFYIPQTEQDKNDYQYGRFNAWKSYSKEKSPEEMDYNGYVLFADPFHYGQKRISFLLGSDCSNFVQRLYQLMGADFPYAKTRHWLALAKENAERPSDFSDCRWQNLKKSFQKISEDLIQVGDIAVYANAVGEMGEHGHMGIIASTKPFLYLNNNKKDGYSLNEKELSTFLNEKKPVFFRFIGTLNPLENYSVKERLKRQYSPDNSGCR